MVLGDFPPPPLLSLFYNVYYKTSDLAVIFDLPLMSVAMAAKTVPITTCRCFCHYILVVLLYYIPSDLALVLDSPPLMSVAMAAKTVLTTIGIKCKPELIFCQVHLTQYITYITHSLVT